MKAIVLGANGYLGRHIAHFWKNAGNELMPCGHSTSSIDDHSNYQSIDISNFDEVQSLDFNVDYIFVFAGMTGTSIGFDQYQQFVNVNELGLLNVLNHHKNTESKARIVFPSTRLVYKGVKDKFLKESDEKEAKTVYAQNKLACEGYLKMYADYFDIPYTTFRICVPYGNLFDDSYSYGTVGFFLTKAKNKEDITLFGDGTLRRTFTHVEDISRIILQAINQEESINQTYNIGSEDNLSLKEVASLIAEKEDVGVSFVKWPEQALKLESGDTIFDGEKLKSLTNFEYSHQISNWIKSL